MEAGVFIEKWRGSAGGRERSNFPAFISGLCELLGVDPPQNPAEKGVLGAYEYEAPIKNASVRVAKLSGQTGFADLYKRGHFLLEAKQSYLKEGQSEPVRSDGSAYDQLMRGAYLQAHNYAANIDSDHPNVPFLIVCDIGRAFEVYFDWAGNGRGFEPFPDSQSYRITLDQLADETVRARLKGIWTNPDALDPRKIAADVTRRVAVNLAQVSEALEGKIRRDSSLGAGQRAEAMQEAALFLMRILFCMFAEDVGLLKPEKCFQNFLEGSLENERGFEHGLADLWTNMGQPNRADRYAYAVEAQVPYFNGGLFRNHRTFPLITSDRELLLQAARADWTNVEPAIFGTMLEKALGDERDKLGAHYTPRKYVEFLVRKTFIDDLEAEWAAIEELAQGGSARDALASAAAFHDRLAGLKVLDPACGTGNFLYVAMELMLNLEARLIRLVRDLGGTASQRVDPRQFFGLELNPGAAKITELVLWIGWLRKRMAEPGSGLPDPVLATLQTINFGDLASFDSVVRRRIEEVAVAGSERTQRYLGDPDTANPGPPDWPEADYIVGNPPFTGGKDLRADLGDAYAQALWAANPDLGRSADLVMYWWNHAARILTTPGTRLRRFGFVTTNSITQEFSRRVIAGYLAQSSPSSLGEGDREAVEGRRGEAGASLPASAVPPPAAAAPPPPFGRSPSPSKLGEDFSPSLSIIVAVPDHPWHKLVRDEKVRGVARRGEASLKQARKAAVRIAMTVAEAGAGKPGHLFEVAHEAALDSDNPVVEFHDPQGTLGVINADLSIGADVTKARALRANAGLSSPGVKLHGDGFIVEPDYARDKLGLGTRPGLDMHIRPYRNGRDLMQHSRGAMVIDLFGLSEAEVMDRFPEVGEHLLETVKPERDGNNRKSYRDNWWIFGEPRSDLRPALADLPRYIATVETAKHRVFQFLDAAILPDNKLILIGSDQAWHLGVLSARIHVQWSLRAGGWLGAGNDPVYVKSKVFDPFPFPDASPAQQAAIAELAERLDRQRKEALAETPGLTMTEIYNLRDAVAKGGAPTRDQRDRASAARARIVDELHRQLDAVVAEAYGWDAALSPAEIVARLVALNAARAAEEAAGHIRWLRPEYQQAPALSPADR